MSTPVHKGRLLAVGDIHGCWNALQGILDHVSPRTEDQWIFLGDYIDRGPDSRGVLDTLLDFSEKFPNTVFLRGNHERMLLDYLDSGDRFPYLLNGGLSTLANYGGLTTGIPSAHRHFLEQLVPYHQQDGFIFVHAGLRPGVPLKDQSEHDLLWIRDDFLMSDYSWGDTVVFGHTPQRTPLLQNERIGLDTGAVYGRELTCCEVHTRRFWSASEEFIRPSDA